MKKVCISSDLIVYCAPQHIYHHPIRLDGAFEDLISSLTELMEPLARSISSTGLMRTPEDRRQLRHLKQFTVLQAMRGMFNDKSHAKLIGSAQMLHKLAMALTYLVSQGGFGERSLLC